jgi:hypothetical protein
MHINGRTFGASPYTEAGRALLCSISIGSASRELPQTRLRRLTMAFSSVVTAPVVSLSNHQPFLAWRKRLKSPLQSSQLGAG